MPRRKKCRKVCRLPKNNTFLPITNSKDNIVLSVDEYEAIRLIDKEELSQDECAKYMQIARTTAQQIYNNAKKKIATALVEGFGIIIDGGEYELCETHHEHCYCEGKFKV